MVGLMCDVWTILQSNYVAMSSKWRARHRVSDIAQVRSVSYTVFAVLYVMLWLCYNAASLCSCVYQLYVTMMTCNRQLSAVGHQCWQRQWQGWQNGGRVFVDLPNVHNLVRKLQRVCAFYICGEGRFYLYNRRFLHMFKYNHIYINLTTLNSNVYISCILKNSAYRPIELFIWPATYTFLSQHLIVPWALAILLNFT